MLLFAETSDSTTAVLMMVSGLIGSAGTFVVNYITSRHDKIRAEQKEDERTIVDHMKVTQDRLELENKQLKEEGKGRDKLILRILSHIMYLEGILESQGIKFRKINLDTDSGTHSPLRQPTINTRTSTDAEDKLDGEGEE